MRITIILDDELVRKAKEFTGIEENATLLPEALTRLVQREAARRLAVTGGLVPDCPDVPRREKSERKPAIEEVFAALESQTD